MSCSLYYKPISKDYYRVGDIQLREILEKKFGYPCILDGKSISYLKGLEDAGVEGANDIIKAIYEYDEIELYLEC